MAQPALVQCLHANPGRKPTTSLLSHPSQHAVHSPQLLTDQPINTLVERHNINTSLDRSISRTHFCFLNRFELLSEQLLYFLNAARSQRTLVTGHHIS